MPKCLFNIIASTDKLDGDTPVISMVAMAARAAYPAAER